MELTFFTGYHGAGKTYAANQLIEDGFDAVIVDCGPIIRGAFAKSGVTSFEEWIHQQETELGERWDDVLLLNSIRTTVSELPKKPKHLFIVGNRNIQTIEFLRERLTEGKADKIIFLERPFDVMKLGYEARTGRTFTHQEFSAILLKDESMGLLQIREHIESNPKLGAIIISEGYDLKSVRDIGRTILGMKVITQTIEIGERK